MSASNIFILHFRVLILLYSLLVLVLCMSLHTALIVPVKLWTCCAEKAWLPLLSPFTH